MNERFKKFAEQAHSYAVEQTGEFSPEYLGFYDKKFAELIVRECAKICADTAVIDPPNDLLEGYNLGVNKAAENIKEHFAIE